MPGGELVFTLAAAAPHTGRDFFADGTAYEAFVNKFYFADFSAPEFASQPVDVKIAHALRLSDEVGRLAAFKGCGVCVYFSVHADDDDIVWRFHRYRPGDLPWAAPASTFGEPLAYQRWCPR